MLKRDVWMDFLEEVVHRLYLLGLSPQKAPTSCVVSDGLKSDLFWVMNDPHVENCQPLGFASLSPWIREAEDGVENIQTSSLLSELKRTYNATFNTLFQ